MYKVKKIGRKWMSNFGYYDGAEKKTRGSAKLL
jgi:hypothetical protein